MMSENAAAPAIEHRENGGPGHDGTRLPSAGKRPGYLLLYIGVIHPLLVLGMEITTGMCACQFFDPLPTLWHVLLVAFAPAGNLLLWLALRDGVRVDVRILAAVNGIVIGTTFLYTIVFLPLLPFALIGALMLIGLLPLAPLLALIAALRQQVYLKERARETGRRLPAATGLGLGIFLLFAVVLHASAVLTTYGMHLAASGDTRSERSFGIKLLRRVGDERIILRKCYSGRAPTIDLLGLILPRDFSLTRKKAREIYFRVTGVPFNSVPAPRRSRQGIEFFRLWSFDSEQGGDAVAGKVRRLYLAGSRIDGSADGDAALAYLEWTLVFRNDSPLQREARARIALPPGGVVSRLTLWVDGEEREAVFAGRGKVRKAYKKIVRARRDPVLVTQSGPDQVLVQCFPVPGSGGTMRIRLGITVPLALEGGEEALLSLPSIVERNFEIAPETSHLVWIEAKRELRSSAAGLVSEHVDGKFYGLRGSLSDEELGSPATLIRGVRSPAIKSVRSPDIGEDSSAWIVQTIESVEEFTPDRVIVVVDGSLSMREYKEELERALSAFPKNIELSLLIAGNEVIEPTWRPAPTDPRLISRLTRRLSEFRFLGGRDNAPALARAWDLSAAAAKGAVLWIHGAQPTALGSVEGIVQRYNRRRGGPRLYNLAVSRAPDAITERLGRIRSMEPVHRIGTLEQDIERLFARWTAGGTVLKAVRKKVFPNGTDAPPDSKRTSDHLARLWACDMIRALETTGKQDSLKEAMRVAKIYRLVTETTGAVVLENRADYVKAGLTPPESVESSDVPSVPEPETWALIIVSLLALAWTIRKRRTVCARY
jgi:hypothetical protein